jgi:hypothetical protein
MQQLPSAEMHLQYQHMLLLATASAARCACSVRSDIVGTPSPLCTSSHLLLCLALSTSLAAFPSFLLLLPSPKVVLLHQILQQIIV